MSALASQAMAQSYAANGGWDTFMAIITAVMSGDTSLSVFTIARIAFFALLPIDGWFCLISIAGA